MRYLVNRPVNLFGDFDRVLNNLFEDNSRISKRTPSVDISVDNDGYTLEVELPGFSEKDIDVKVEEGKLIIGSIKEVEENKEKTETEESRYLLKERNRGDFSRVFILPKDADAEAITASFNNGILTIKIKKSPEKQARSIKIKAA